MRHQRMATLTLALMVWLMVGCTSQSEEAAEQGAKTDTIKIYSSLFPLADFAEKIGGERVEVKSIIPAGTDAHDFELTAQEMVKISEADLFLYNGAGLEPWIEQITQNLDTEKTKVVNSTEGLNESLIEGYHGHDEEKTKKEHGHTDDHGQWNPHIWLDPVLAKQQAQKIRDALIEKDPDYKQDYLERYQSLEQKFNQLDQEFTKMTNKAIHKTFIVSHDAFVYLAKRYELQQIPISGLSPSAEPSPKQLSHIVELMKKHDLKTIFMEEMAGNRIAKVVQTETQAQTLFLHPLEGITQQQLDAGDDYFSIMRRNLAALAKGLGAK